MRPQLGRVVLGVAALALAAPSSFAKDEGAEATVVCKDGSISKAGRGACRGHGGVDKAASKKASGAAAPAAAEKKARKEREPAERTATRATKADEKAAATTVVCKDGSISKGGRGACRGHGGVDKGATARGAGATPVPPAAPSSPHAAAPPAPAPAAPAPVATPPARGAAPAAAVQRAPRAPDDRGPPTARCNDGTFSYARHHTGACSSHGGVAEWLEK